MLRAILNWSLHKMALAFEIINNRLFSNYQQGEIAKLFSF
jgi:hypothetical protein